MITLASDFGAPYPAAMRGVILTYSDARLVDLTHRLPRQDIQAAAFWIRELIPWFPPAVHCVVVDPGVGTSRRAVAVRVGDHCLVGPDNGVLMPTIRRLDGEPTPYEIDLGTPASNTFHGRDVFAPAAARIHEAQLDELADQPFLSPCSELVDTTLPTPTATGETITGVVLAVDEFGNAVTNIPGDAVTASTLRVNGVSVAFVESFADVPVGDQLVTVGSHGNLELAVNQGRGDAVFGVSTGTTVVVEPDET